LLAYLAEVDARRLYAEQACTSTWDFCVRKLGMSESEAQRRIAVARLVRSFPLAGRYLERGEIHLCALYELSKHLNEDNHQELLREAVGKTTKAVAEMIAARFPKPDVHGCVEPLAPQPALPAATAGILQPSAPNAPSEVPLPAPTHVRARVEPLSASRYRVELTVSTETKAMLERIQDLMRHRNPSGDLETIFEASLELLLTKLERERLGKTPRSKSKSRTAMTDADGAPSSAPPKPARRGHVARAVRREVWARDSEQCTYVDADGNRCPARGFLELDHIDAKALGGGDEAANIRLRCRVHNHLHAEQVFGRAYIEERIHLRQRKYARTAEAQGKHVAAARAQAKSAGAARAQAKSVAAAEAQGKPVAAARAQGKPVAAAQGQGKSVAAAQGQGKSAAIGQAPSFEAAARGLRSLGFREPEVREVITRLTTNLDPDASIETIVRDALRLLT